MGLFDSLKRGLSKTRNRFLGSLEALFGAYDEVDDDFFDELEETLILADIGMETAMDIYYRSRLAEKYTRERKACNTWITRF